MPRSMKKSLKKRLRDPRPQRETGHGLRDAKGRSLRPGLYTPRYPEGLPEEVANLLEFPFSVVGSFEEKYLELPEKVLITVLAHHQRFFCLANQEGKLVPYFVAFSGNTPNGLIKTGYERVVRARLEDALFFYREDLKILLGKSGGWTKRCDLSPKGGQYVGEDPKAYGTLGKDRTSPWLWRGGCKKSKKGCIPFKGGPAYQHGKGAG
jgi:hypothetical protein